MHRTMLIVPLIALAVSGCDNSSQDRQANRPAIKVRGPEQERLHELNAFDLAIALKRAIWAQAASRSL